MLTVESVLEIMQSLWIEAKAVALPETPLPAYEFEKVPVSDLWNARIFEKCIELLGLDCAMPAGIFTMKEGAAFLLDNWRKSPRKIRFRTSGSQGMPQCCEHGFEDLLEEASFLKSRFPALASIVSAAPVHHCYGFMFGLWLPLYLDLPVRRTSALPANFFAALAEDALGVGFPLLYDKPLIPSGSAFLSCATGPFSSRSFNRLLEAGYRIIEIFGSSETGVLGYREEPERPFTLLPYFKKKRDCLVRNGRKMAIMDKLSWLDDRHFISLGRKDKVVQVGGKNVSLRMVSEHIRKCGRVLDCAVRPMRADEGKRLKAFIVLAEDYDEREVRRELEKWLKLLPAEARPASLRFGQALPVNQMGKLSDW